MAAHPTWAETYEGPPPAKEQISVERGMPVTDFNEYTFRAPRPGLFLGDSKTPSGEINPIAQFRLEGDEIAQSPPSRPFLGSFDRLPVEILILMLPWLDLCSLFAFRSVNQRSKEVVDSLQAFQAVAAFPMLLGAVLKLQCCFYDLETLARCIKDPTCSYCGHFGDFLYLITAKRCCYKCWREREEIEVQVVSPLPADIDAFQAFADVPHVLLSEGYYGVRGNGVLHRSRLAFDQRAFRAKPNSPHWHLIPKPEQDPHFLRYVAVIRAPYFDEFTQSFEEGFLCRACAYQGWEHKEINFHAQMRGVPFPSWGVPWRRYTRDGMREHINQYGRVFRLEESNGGSRYAHEYPFPRFSPWSENALELIKIGSFLRGCRDKEDEYPQLQPYLFDSERRQDC